MTLAASGIMSIGGSDPTRSINLELGRAAGATSSMGESALRTLAGVPSGAISMSNFYGKSSVSYTSPIDPTAYSFSTTEAYCTITFKGDGTIVTTDFFSGTSTQNWASPTGSYGTSHEAKFVQVFITGGGFISRPALSPTWVSLNGDPEFYINQSGNGLTQVIYTYEIRKTGGAVVVTGSVGLTAEVNNF
jgi:hypothetical protein